MNGEYLSKLIAENVIYNHRIHEYHGKKHISYKPSQNYFIIFSDERKNIISIHNIDEYYYNKKFIKYIVWFKDIKNINHTIGISYKTDKELKEKIKIFKNIDNY